MAFRSLRPSGRNQLGRLTGVISPGIPWILWALTLCLVQPWGQFPVNDDWHYAHVAKQWAETHHLTMDVPTIASLVGQAFLGSKVVQIFGFSHLALRCLTLVISFVLLGFFDLILRRAGLKSTGRVCVLSCLVLNPLYLHFSTSFMTELYGFFPAFAGAALWLYRRQRDPADALLNPWLLVAALLVGSSFWVRQFSVLVFPALLLAAWIVDRKWARNLWLPTLMFSLSVAAYFVWSRLSGNFKAQFASPLGNLLRLNPSQWMRQPWIFLIYMTVFLGPLLWLTTRHLKVTRSRALLLFASFEMGVFAYIFFKCDRSHWPQANLHYLFPFLGNVLTASGVGPVTLSDVYVQNGAVKPGAYQSFWTLVQIIAMTSAPFLWLKGYDIVSKARRLPSHTLEVLVFGLALAGFSVFVVIQSFQGLIFDRYHLGAFLGLLLSVGALLVPVQDKLSRHSIVAFVLLLLPVSVFSIAGVHDYFRWNEERWAAYSALVDSGIDPQQIDGGYEINGWNAFERPVKPEEPACDVLKSWFCPDRPYRIGLNLNAGDEVIAARSANSWLKNFPPILVTKAKK